MARTKKKWYQNTKTYRYIIQGLVFLFILELILKVFPRHDEYVSAESYCPFGGFAGLYEFISTGWEKTITHINTSNLIIFGLLILITLLFRSGFCGWICPFGTLQDLVRAIGKKVGGLSLMKPLNRKYHKWLKENSNMLSQIDKKARYFKYFLLVWAIVSAAYYAHLEFREYDPFASILKLVEFEISTGLYILGIILILGLFIDRPWCKYACPLGATVGIISKLSPSRIVRNQELCTNCNLCSKNCPMNIDVANLSHVTSSDCSGCLECVDVCPTEGALDMKIILPGKSHNQPQTVDTIKE